MSKSEEVLAAYVLWGKLLELEKRLRTRYSEEFLSMVNKDPSLLPPEASIEDLIPF
jgi:hypothetical protein